MTQITYSDDFLEGLSENHAYATEEVDKHILAIKKAYEDRWIEYAFFICDTRDDPNTYSSIFGGDMPLKKFVTRFREHLINTDNLN